MEPDAFDATITLNDHHLEAAGLSGCKAQAAAAVREAVERMDGAGWIDVEAQSYPPDAAGWVIVYPQGRCIAPDTPEWPARTGTPSSKRRRSTVPQKPMASPRLGIADRST
jgi:hypothetical protein